jgi:hypothetical protein
MPDDLRAREKTVTTPRPPIADEPPSGKGPASNPEGPKPRHPNLRRPWPPGVSGNPEGRRVERPDLREIRELARTYTEEALETLVRIMRRGRSETARLAAACAILDRAYGKPAVAIEHSGPDGQTLFPSPAELRQLSDGQLERLRTFLQEFSAEVEGNGGAPR